MKSNPTLTKTLPLLALLLFLLALAAMILWQNSGRSNPLFALFSKMPNHDKIGHFLLMGLLSFLAVIASNSLIRKTTRPQILLPILLVALFVAAEEVSQIFIRSRTFSLTDLFASWLGVALFGALAAHIASIVAKNTQ